MTSQSDQAYNPRPGLVYANPARYFLRQFTPSVSVSPTQIAFALTLVNNLDRVFRSTGAVISLSVDGRTIAFDQSGILELLSVVLVPRAQAQVTIRGPSLQVLQRSGTISLFVYDVVTAVDAAGNPARRENFAWHYTYTLEPQTESVPHRYSDIVCINPSGAEVVNPNPRAYPACY